MLIKMAPRPYKENMDKDPRQPLIMNDPHQLHLDTDANGNQRHGAMGERRWIFTNEFEGSIEWYGSDDNNVKQGKYFKQHKDGTMLQGVYRDDQKHGLWRHIDKDGNVKKVEIFHHGNLDERRTGKLNRKIRGARFVDNAKRLFVRSPVAAKTPSYNLPPLPGQHPPDLQ